MSKLEVDLLDYKLKFNPYNAEDYFMNQRKYYEGQKNRIFKNDNEGRDSNNSMFSAEYQKYLGMEMAYKEVIDYFSKYEF